MFSVFSFNFALKCLICKCSFSQLCVPSYLFLFTLLFYCVVLPFTKGVTAKTGKRNILIHPMLCFIHSKQANNKKGTVETKAFVNIEPKPKDEEALKDSSDPEVSAEKSKKERKRSRAGSMAEDKNRKERDSKKEKKEKPPKISSELVDQEAIEGSEVKFTCKVRGTPTPEVEWSRDGKKIKPSDMFIITSDGERHSLIIRTVTVEYTGTYTVKVNTGRIYIK